ncbi:OmpP1/FadL family transporter [Pedobacter sp. SYP-B3415]|uniref:OmpP1/FadL family transporter n=1 Tax=Pedobacter sp. SYP-B3415 TaxID=2496641 RepID=UPI00101DDCC3|nr:outer membrane protein transport protein [Pedobacter sp. SYP-B3415]
MRKILLSMLVAAPVLGFAQSFQVNLQGQKQIGMAGAGTGLALDEASVFFNPGAVSFLKKNGVQAGISPLFLKTAFRAAGSDVTEYNKSKLATPLEAYATFGSPEGKLRFGIGIYTPFGGAMHWDENWTGKFTVTSLDLQAIFVQPTVSYKLTDWLGIGAGFVYANGKVDLRRALPITRADGSSATAQLEGHSHNFGWNAGIFADAGSGLTFGITHRSKVDATVKDGDARFEVPDALRSTFPTTFNATLNLPATTSLGIGYKVSEQTTLALDVNWVQWHRYKTLAFDYDNNARIPDTESPRNYKDAGALRLGGQHEIDNKFVVRAGVGYAITPVREGYVTPEVPDADRWLLSAGLGYKPDERFQIDLSFLYENVKSRTETNLETNLSGTFKTAAYIPGISLSYKW